MLFSIEVEGRHVPCAISRGALEALCGGRHLRNNDLLHSFAQVRGRIDEIAAAIFTVRPESATGILSIWADDIDDPPAAPAASGALVSPDRKTASSAARA